MFRDGRDIGILFRVLGVGKWEDGLDSLVEDVEFGKVVGGRCRCASGLKDSWTGEECGGEEEWP
jgi:hypothetical protein